MKAYVIVQETVTDEETFAEYRSGVVATLEEFGGRFIVRGGAAHRGRRRVAASAVGDDRVPFAGCRRGLVPFPGLPEAAALAAAQRGRQPGHRRRRGMSRCARTSFAPIPSRSPTTPTSLRPPARRSSSSGWSVTVSDLYADGVRPVRAGRALPRPARPCPVRRAGRAAARLADRPLPPEVAAEIARLDAGGPADPAVPDVVAPAARHAQGLDRPGARLRRGLHEPGSVSSTAASPARRRCCR